MKLSMYDVIVGPVVSNKAYRLHQTLKKLTLRVHPEANKALVSQAMRTLFNVQVESVNIMVRKGKRKISRSRNVSIDNLKKFAIVTLKSGQEMNFFTDAASVNVSNVQQPSNNDASK